MAGSMPRDIVGALRRSLHVACVAVGLAWSWPAAAGTPPWPAPADGILVNDPSVTWGRLANGLRYAILPNQTPPGRVSLRLLIEAGSLMENEQQRGLSHFLEHMAFKGSTNMPPGELIGFLQRAGLAFGPDTNAATSFDTTVFQLDLPRNDTALVGQGLGILSEFDGRLLLAGDQIDSERGVILSEKRLRDTPDSRSFQATLDFLMPGSLYAEREPIGLEPVIREAPRERFAQFYHDWYTPERSVVIVVGDIEPGAVAKMIEEHFGAFTQPQDAPPDPALGTPPVPHVLDATLVSDPGLRTSISLNTVLPYDHRPDSLAKERDELVQMLAMAMLDRRLDSLALSPGAPFARASVGASDLAPAARIASVRLLTTPESWQKALTVAEQELRRALTFGFGEAELAEQLEIFRSGFAAAAASASTRDSAELAEQLVDVITDQAVFTTPANDLAVVDALTRGLRPEEVDAALQAMWGGREPQIVLTGPIELEQPKEAILAAYRASAAVAVEPPATVVTQPFAYTDFGPSSGVVAKEELPRLGITRVTYGNGVVLDLKPTGFEADTVHVAVRFGSGRIGLPPDQPGLDLLAAQGFTDGGLGRHSIEEVTRIMASRHVGVDLAVGEGGVNLFGQTTRADLPLQLDLLAAYVTDPAYRPEAIERFRARLASVYARMAAVPEGALQGPVALLLHDDDSRFAVPPQAVVERRTLAELRQWLEPMLRSGPLQVVVVGDADPATVIAEVGRTFGALPPRGRVAAPAPPTFTLPAAHAPVRFTHQGPADQALALVYWPTTGRGDAEEAIGLDLVADILNDRLLQEVRGHEGATYSPDAGSEMSLVLPGYGHIGAAVDVRAADAERIVGLIRDVGAEMQAGGITADEFDRALQPRLAQARTAEQRNDYWLYDVMLGMEQYPQTLDAARSLLADYEGQTLAEVQALATRYLRADKALPVLIVPAAAAGDATGEGADVGNAVAPPVPSGGP